MGKLLSALLVLATMNAFGQYDLIIEQVDAGELGIAYQLYVEANNPTDKLSAIFGNDQSPTVFNTPDGIYNNAFNSSWNASGVNPTLLSVFPELAFDSYATIGLSGPASATPGAQDPSLVQDASLSPTVSGYFQTGGTELNIDSFTGASWYVLNTASNALPDENGRWLIAQITTTGDLSGSINAQIFPQGVGADQVQQSWDFGGGWWGGPCGADLPLPMAGCMDESACNYNECATWPDLSNPCLYMDATGNCSVLCGADVNENGICDFNEPLGCTYPLAINYDEVATEDDGSCIFQPCGEGTIWNEQLQECVIENPSDTDFDGCVGLSDFLVHLAAYGSGCDLAEENECGAPVEFLGHTYETVQLGSDCWFAENLRTTMYRTGAPISESLDNDAWSLTAEGALSVYGEGLADCESLSPHGDACDEEWALAEFGVLYNWHAVSNSQQLCPTGWHVPTDVEWQDLEVALGMDADEASDFGWRGTHEGKKLKYTSGWAMSGHGTNESGFAAKPGGYRLGSGAFAGAGTSANFWSSSQVGSSAWLRSAGAESDQVFRQGNTQQLGLSVRCIKDPQ